MTNANGNNQAVFGQQAANLIGLRSACFDKALPRTMHAQDGLLLNRFNRHTGHVRSHHCFANGLGIGCIILVALDEWLDVLGWNQLHRVSHRHQLPRPEMRAAASFHAYLTRD